MTPSAKFHTYVAAITVGLIFVSLHALHQYIPKDNNADFAAGLLLTAIIALGLYRLVASTMATLLPKWPLLFEFTMGAHYLRGTWGGTVLAKDDQTHLVVEKVEQTLDDVRVRGWAFGADQSLLANWTSEFAQIAPTRGELFCFYSVNIPHNETLIDSLGRMQFDRPSESRGPSVMTGYILETVGEKRLRYRTLQKLSHELPDLDVAKEQVVERFARYSKSRSADGTSHGNVQPTGSRES